MQDKFPHLHKKKRQLALPLLLICYVGGDAHIAPSDMRRIIRADVGIGPYKVS